MESKHINRTTLVHPTSGHLNFCTGSLQDSEAGCSRVVYRSISLSTGLVFLSKCLVEMKPIGRKELWNVIVIDLNVMIGYPGWKGLAMTQGMLLNLVLQSDCLYLTNFSAVMF